MLTNLVSFILSDSLGELLLQNDIELERLKSNCNEIHMQLHKLDKSVQIWCGVSSLGGGGGGTLAVTSGWPPPARTEG